MNAYTRSVSARIPGRVAFYAIGIAALATTMVFATGLAHLPGHDAASPLVTTMAPVPDSSIAPLLALDRATEAVAAQVTPTVVYISVSGRTKPDIAQQQPDEQDIPAPFRQFFQFQRPQPQDFRALGTGVIVSPDGYIVTNNHVVKDANHVSVTLNDKREFDAKVVGTDAATDLAVVKINATGLTSAAWGDSSQLRPGESVLAIGDPMDVGISVTRGIVSALDRSRLGDGPNSRGSFIQTDAPINHGNSGGPLVNARGQVVGINTEILSQSGASDGIGFAIPSNLVKPVAESLIKNGKVVRGYLGIDVTDVTPRIADSLNESGTQGALVDQVVAGSPAAAAGVKPYDVVTGLNGNTISTGTDLQTLAGAVAPGSKVNLAIMRDGKPMQLTLTAGDYANAGNDSAEPASSSSSESAGPKLGVNVQALTPDVRNQLQLPDSVNGVVVASVTPGGPAMLAGIANGDVIEQINRHAVTSPEGLRRQLSQAPAGKDVLLLVHKANGDFILPIHPEQ